MSFNQINQTFNNNSDINGDSNGISKIMNYFDIFARCVLLLSHAIYFIVVLLFKEFHKISYFNMHHTNLIGLLSAILYCAWINSSQVDVSKNTFYNIACNASEFFWPVLRYTRTLSLLILAIYRYLAVFNNKLFKKLTVSFKYNLVMAFKAWLISIIIFLISKYSLNTSPSTIMCVDGSTSSLKTSIIYYIITTVPCYIIPSILIIVFYTLIQSKLNSLSNSLSRSNQKEINQCKKLKESKLAIQLFLLNFFNILSIICLMLVTLNRWLPILEKNFYYLRQLWRVINNLSQSVIPLLSIGFYSSQLKYKDISFHFSIYRTKNTLAKS